MASVCVAVGPVLEMVRVTLAGTSEIKLVLSTAQMGSFEYANAGGAMVSVAAMQRR